MCIRNSPGHVLLWLLPVRLVLDFLAAITFFIKNDKKNSFEVLRAYKDIVKWLFTEKNKFPAKTKSLGSIPFVYQHSIVWKYYVKKVKHYSGL